MFQLSSKVQGWLLMIGPKVSLVTKVATELETKSCVRILRIMSDLDAGAGKHPNCTTLLYAPSTLYILFTNLDSTEQTDL